MKAAVADQRPQEIKPILIALMGINGLVVFFLYQRFEQTASIVRQLLRGEEMSIFTRLPIFIPAIILIATGFYLSVSIFQYGNSLQKNVASALVLVMLIVSFYVCFVVFLPAIELQSFDRNMM